MPYSNRRKMIQKLEYDMSKKRTVYSAEFKSKLVLELLKNEKTVAEIASANLIKNK